jgi:hypothetical protein
MAWGCREHLNNICLERDLPRMFRRYGSLSKSHVPRHSAVSGETGSLAPQAWHLHRAVLWLMMVQILQRRGTLASAVQALREGACAPLLFRCPRVRQNRISARTGGYCQARLKLPAIRRPGAARPSSRGKTCSGRPDAMRQPCWCSRRSTLAPRVVPRDKRCGLRVRSMRRRSWYWLG